MKTTILRSFFLGVILTLNAHISQAQNNHAYAITGESKGNLNWTVIRELDLSTGELIRDIYLPAQNNAIKVDALTGRQIQSSNNKLIQNNTRPQISLPDLMAAAALDVKTNRLFFTPLMGTQLHYIDLNAGARKIYVVQNQLLRSFPVKPGEEDNITRMTFASDGYGYALTNNSNHLIRFTSEKNIEITDLGNLLNGINNGNNSVYNQPDNWGGDMIGDAFGNLILFTVKGNVFKINPQTRVTDFIGRIKNLPEGYTVNAAAVDKDGAVVIGCAIHATDYFKVNLANLEATAIQKKDASIYNVSDFACSNLAYAKEALNSPEKKSADKEWVSVFPNPVAHKNFTILFNQASSGIHSVELMDLSGKRLMNKSIDVTKQQTEKIILPVNAVAGVYLLKITNRDNHKMHTEKLIVE